jgi:hypothetical protein
MNRKMRWLAGTATAVLLAATPLLAGQGHGCDHARHIQAFDGEKFDLADLYDGETRTFGYGENEIVATRIDDVVKITFGDVDAERTFECQVDSGTCIVMVPEDGEGKHVIIMKSSEGDYGVGEDVMIMATSFGDAGRNAFFIGEDGGAFELHLDGDQNTWVSEDGADRHLIRVMGESGTTLRCPEGDTTMRLKTDEQDEGPYYCPKHNIEMEPVRKHAIKELMLRVHEEDDDQ